MSLWALMLAVAAAVAIAGCGGSRIDFRDHHQPATPVELSVYVDDARVSLSPARIGAGLVQLDVANQATRPETIALVSHSGDRTVASSGRLQPDTTATLTADLRTGSYALTGSARGLGNPNPIKPARLTVGRAREAGDSALLQP